jgi:hypothetical protein
LWAAPRRRAAPVDLVLARYLCADGLQRRQRAFKCRATVPASLVAVSAIEAARRFKAKRRLDPTGRLLGITYGTWRRVVDDAHYPDIAQDASIIAVDPSNPAAQASSVVHASASEDRALCWSPNGKWIVHSHKDQSDASGSSRGRRHAASPHQLPGARRRGWVAALVAGQSLAPVDGAANRRKPSCSWGLIRTRAGDAEAIELPLGRVDAEVSHAGSCPTARIVVISKEVRVGTSSARWGATAGRARGYRFASEHDAPECGSPDGDIAFIAWPPTGSFRCSRPC